MLCTFVAFIFSYSGQLSTPQLFGFLSPAQSIKNFTSEKHGERGGAFNWTVFEDPPPVHHTSFPLYSGSHKNL